MQDPPRASRSRLQGWSFNGADSKPTRVGLGFRNCYTSREVLVNFIKDKSTKNKKLVDRLNKYEKLALTSEEEQLLFAELLQTGMVWRLKGVRGQYGERAMELLREGVIEEPIGLKVLGNHDWRGAADIDVREHVRDIEDSGD